MDKEDQKIEEFLKNRISAISPLRAVFDRVTNQIPNRNNKVKDYKLINFVMTKGQYVGLALGVIAIVAIVSVSKSDTKLAMTNDEQVQTDTGSQFTNEKKVVTEDPSKQSADEIMASFYADADSEATYANSESEEDAYMNSQIDAFTSFNETNYENI